MSGFALPTEPAAYRDWTSFHRLREVYGRMFTELGVPVHHRPHRLDPASGKPVGDPEFAPEHANLAAQSALERSLIQVARTALAEACSTRLCVAGIAIGAALEYAHSAGAFSVPGRPMLDVARGPEFEALTGVPALLNTSFDHEAEPIVCSPADALRTF
ncbi:carbamoyltransferase C-terminal domain-containing protein [Streptomyces acidiscabies]|uniref:Carbamoyltransferase C-terminal domain-containing protein n=1 Tax=Streptomyces acidiscabies TaxID=42234 RepID=A0A0L0KHH8_9ACTN|nr:carbamoyltransferase C-terminal domain-containing protein [Streptomyces acidiscabies]KND37318.1 hypothetical protein IQ63_10410 [Streptomyces acidiscabies]